jgi:methionyl-tRNA formyltransferase
MRVESEMVLASVTPEMPPLAEPLRVQSLKIGWLGFHEEGEAPLQALLQSGWKFDCLVTLHKEQLAARSGAVDFGPFAEAHGIPLFRVSNINDADAQALLRPRQLDLLFVIGWGQILRPEALMLARLGVVGSHASLLPHNRGSAPVNWCLIQGERTTGCTLFWLDPAVDRGDIIAQEPIPITPYDTCATIYQKVGQANASMILDLLEELDHGRLPRRAQGKSEEQVLPRRRPKDGLIDWTQSADRLYDFIRALARPYPGAFSWLGDTRYRIWTSALLDLPRLPTLPPGTVIGASRSPEPRACGQIVACGTGALLLLELEKPDGDMLTGAQLSERTWRGMVWHDG